MAQSWFQVHISRLHPDFNETDLQKYQAEGISKAIEPVHDFRVDYVLQDPPARGGTPATLDSHVANAHMKSPTQWDLTLKGAHLNV